MYFELLDTIYNDPTDEESQNSAQNNENSSKEVSNINVEPKDNKKDSYHFSGSVEKNLMDKILDTVSNTAPSVMGVLGGVQLGKAVIKSSGGTITQKAALGVGTAIGATLGLSSASVLSKAINKNILKKDDVDDGDDKSISSVLEFGENISPLQTLLNYEIVICFLILFHMVILILILFNKLSVLTGMNIFSKLISPNIKVKFEKYKVMVENLGNRFLMILFIINAIILIFDIFLLIYVNFELSTNLDDYIYVHNKINKSIIYLFLFKFNDLKSDKNILPLFNDSVRCFTSNAYANFNSYSNYTSTPNYNENARTFSSAGHKRRLQFCFN